MYRRIILGYLIMLFLIQASAQNSDSIDFSSSSVTVTFQDNHINSSILEVNFQNLPDLAGGEVKVRLSDDLVTGITSSNTAEFDINIISSTQTISVVFLKDNIEYILANRTSEFGVWVHLKHVYSNWTFGQPPPADHRGYGQGAIRDALVLQSFTDQTITTMSDGKKLGEKILNLLIGADTSSEFTDWNNDGSADAESDGYGLIEYSYGLRDHIAFVGNSEDASQEEKDHAAEISTNMTNSIFDASSYSEFIDLGYLNSSASDLAKIYQYALNMTTQTDVDKLNSSLVEISKLTNNRLLPILYTHFNSFRNTAMGIEANLDLVIDLEEKPTTTTSTTEETPFIFVPVALIPVISVIKRKRQ